MAESAVSMIFISGKKLGIFGLDLDLIFQNNGFSNKISIIKIYMYTWKCVQHFENSILFSEAGNMSLKNSHYLWCSKSPKL